WRSSKRHLSGRPRTRHMVQGHSVPSHCSTRRFSSCGRSMEKPPCLRHLLLGRRALKMERVSQVLQFPVIVERGRPFSREFQLLEKLDFLRGRIAPQKAILKEGL